MGENEARNEDGMGLVMSILFSEEALLYYDLFRASRHGVFGLYTGASGSHENRRLFPRILASSFWVVMNSATPTKKIATWELILGEFYKCDFMRTSIGSHLTRSSGQI